MPEFSYEVLDPDGNIQTGKMEGESPHAIALALSERGFRVNTIRPVGKVEASPVKAVNLSWKDVSLISEQLEIFTQSHLPLSSAMGLLAKDVHSPKLKAVLEDIHKHLEMGESLDQALSRHADSFPPVFLSLIKAGEQTGNLPGVLSHLATYSNRMTDIRNSMREMLAYPVFLLVATLSILAYLSAVVIPQYAEIYASVGKLDSLPMATKLALSIGEFVRWGGVLGFILKLGILALAVVLTRMFLTKMRRNGGSADLFVERTKMGFPVLGPVYTTALIARFCRTLGLLLNNKAQTTESLILAGSTAGGGVFRQAGLDAAMLVSKGETLSSALSQTRLFRPSFVWLLGQSEEHGDMGEALLNLADICDREVAHWARLASVLMGPLFVALIALLVLFTITAAFMPVFNLSSLVAS
ncbi:MAG: type II secretion system F family protein [Candidatus Hydrogenedentes bacterium]|nr:type II secretion system F family protein [Candidatus Hydrogenedentota bacterium]